MGPLRPRADKKRSPASRTEHDVNATINGAPRELADGTTVASLLRELGLATGGIAVAVNERVVPSRAFADHALNDGDAVEIIRAVAGG